MSGGFEGLRLKKTLRRLFLFMNMGFEPPILAQIMRDFHKLFKIVQCNNLGLK